MDKSNDLKVVFFETDTYYPDEISIVYYNIKDKGHFMCENLLIDSFEKIFNIKLEDLKKLPKFTEIGCFKEILVYADFSELNEDDDFIISNDYAGDLEMQFLDEIDAGSYYIDFHKLPKEIKLNYIKKSYYVIDEYQKLTDQEKLELELKKDDC